MLPARYRMTRSADFATTIKGGMRASQRDLVVHACARPAESDGPRIGFVVSKAVGNAVARHHVARRLRHATRGVLSQLRPTDWIVIRALPGSEHAEFTRLEDEIQAGLRQIRSREQKR